MIKLIKSSFYQEQKTKKQLMNFIKDADIVSFSEQCQTFEKNFAKYQGRQEAVFVNSGSSANLAVIQALLNNGNLKRGDQVGFSAITWSTNVMPLIELGLQPVPIDVELETLNISPKKFEDVLRHYPKLKMLFLTNLLGFADDITTIAKICQQKNILLIEDNCESLGTVCDGKKLGNFGYASTFSFYVGHHMSTIEGGMICTDDHEFATILRIVRAHGWDRNLAVEEQKKVQAKYKINSQFYSRYTFYDLGYNLRPTEINGFLGNNQLQYLDEIIDKREKNFHRFAKIYQNPLYYSLKTGHLEKISNFAIPIICKKQATRDELIKKVDGKIEIRPIVGGNMVNQPFFNKYVKTNPILVNQNANLIHQNGFYFGNNPELTDDEISLILKLLA